MKVTVLTSVSIAAPATRVWKFLCDASMPTAAPWCFKLGVPTPNECTIVGETTGIGAHRQCRTNKGFVDQRVTEWIPPKKLSFVATSDTIGMYRHVKAMQDTFLLEESGKAVTVLTRRTEFETSGAFAPIKAWLFRMVVRRLHKYVMEGFRSLAERDGI